MQACRLCGCCCLLVVLHVLKDACAFPATMSDGRAPSDVKTDVRYVARQRARHAHNTTCQRETGWGLQGRDWGCCGNYDGCCLFATSVCFVHDALCRCCRLSRFFCGPFCLPDADCPVVARESHPGIMTTSKAHNTSYTADVNDVNNKSVTRRSKQPAVTSSTKWQKSTGDLKFEMEFEDLAKQNEASGSMAESYNGKYLSVSINDVTTIRKRELQKSTVSYQKRVTVQYDSMRYDVRNSTSILQGLLTTQDPYDVMQGDMAVEGSGDEDNYIGWGWWW